MLAKARRGFALYVKIVRLSTFSFVVGLAVTLLIARSVYGSAAESVYELNREWSRKAATLDKQSYRVNLNGQSLMTSSHMSDEGVHAVLQAADDECRAHTGGLDGDIAKLPGAAMAKLTSFVFGVVHREWKNRGFVACFERDGNRGLEGLVNDLGEVAKTGDVGKLGTFRYVSVDRGPNATKTHVLRQWTEGTLNIKSMFPAEGDAPGSDLAEVARPEGSRRVLDASVDGSHFGVRVYEAPGGPEAVLASYDRELAAKGWKKVDLSEQDAKTMRVFDQAGANLFLSASAGQKGSVVSIADMPAN